MQKRYEVNDFVIDNDTVFFCGKDRNGKGTIGFFNIQDLFFNGGAFYVASTFPLDPGYYVATLNKLITYRDATGKRHIVCIGQAAKEDRSLYPCIVDLYSTSGQLMKHLPCHDIAVSIDISVLPAGLYIVRATTVHGMAYTRLVVH